MLVVKLQMHDFLVTLYVRSLCADFCNKCCYSHSSSVLLSVLVSVALAGL